MCRGDPTGFRELDVDPGDDALEGIEVLREDTGLVGDDRDLRPLLEPAKVAVGTRRERLLDLVQSFSVFQWLDGRIVRLVARHQQYRAVGKAVRRLIEGRDPRSRGGLLWHTQGSGKSLTMVFLVRKMRTTEELRGFKVVVVSDRRALKAQLTPVLRLSGEAPQVEDSRPRLSRMTARRGT